MFSERATDWKDIKIFLNVFIVYWYYGTGELLSLSFVHCCRFIFTRERKNFIYHAVRILRTLYVQGGRHVKARNFLPLYEAGLCSHEWN